MTGSLKRHPSEEPEESPKSKRRESPGEEVSSTPTSTETSPTASEKNGDSAPTASSFLSPPTKVGGVSITDKVSLTEDTSKVNGTGNSILSSGFSITSGSSLFSTSNGKKEGSSSSSSTNIFAAALANAGGGGGIFGSASSFSSSSSFVFGANLSDRVISFGAIAGETSDKKETTDETKEGKEETKPAESSSEASSDSSKDKVSSDSSKDKVSLKKLAVASGEEGERRVLQTTCKLYQFCPVSKTWIDRGGGTLRLNEREHDGRAYNRLVIRSKAVMKVMLNTKIFPDMVINRANLTTIRISALDGGKMCTFLLRCTRNECDKLHTALLKRRESERHNTEGGGASVTVKPEPEQPTFQLTSTETLDNPDQDENTATCGETTEEKHEEEKREEGEEVEEDEELEEELEEEDEEEEEEEDGEEVESTTEPSTAEEKESKEEEEEEEEERVHESHSTETEETAASQHASEEENSEPSKETT